MDRFSALFQSIEDEFKLSTVPTNEAIAATRDSNRKGLEDAREQVQAQIDQAFDEIIGFAKYKRASLQSLLSLLAHIDSEIQSLENTPQGGVPL